MARRLPIRFRSLALAVLGVLLLAGALWPMAGRPEPVRRLEGIVLRLVDGDTIHVQVNGRVEKVRYIGVNTPEIHHPGKGEEPGGREAREVNRRLVEGRSVRLEPDVQQRDRYGRLLAYVWLRREDGSEVMVNAELVRLGYAQVMTIPPNVRYTNTFLALQRQARDAHRGLWRQP
jgi:micrococcal nuclease